MAPKLEIALRTHTQAELQAIVDDYFVENDAALADVKPLLGGYSGSNYRIVLQQRDENGRPSTYCLKITNGCTLAQAELMCRTAAALEQGGFQHCCFPLSKLQQRVSSSTAANSSTSFRTNRSDDPLPKHNDDDYDDDKHTWQFVSERERDGVPAFLLTFCTGTQADKVMRHTPALAPIVMHAIGRGLGQLHAAVPLSDGDTARYQGHHKIRWYETDGGCCDVCDHVNDTFFSKIQASPRGDVFLPFYLPALAELKQAMKLTSTSSQSEHLPLGITHGDPFADNILVDPVTGELMGFIDIEDICGGPLLFDLACCAIGCCFVDNDDIGAPALLDFCRFTSLLQGYTTSRPLTVLESQHFLAFMKLTLLCNAAWRFVKFNPPTSSSSDKGVDNVPPEARDSYLELQRRIEYLQDPVVAQQIDQMVQRHAVFLSSQT